MTATSPISDKQIAPQRVDQEVEDLRRRAGAEGDPRGEFRGVAVGIEGDVLLQQLVEHPLLVFGDDVIGDAGHGDGLAIARDPLDGEDHDHRDRDEGDAVEAAVDIGLVDAAAEQEGRQGGAGGADRHEGERQAIAPPMGAAMLGQQPANQRRRALRIGEKAAIQPFEHRRPEHETGAPPRPPPTALADRGRLVHAAAGSSQGAEVRLTRFSD